MVNQSVFMKVAVVLLAALILFASCSSTTLIQSNPSGAKVYMNEEYMGVTPLSYSDTKIVGSTTSLRIEKEGYEPLYTYLTRNEEVDAGAIIGGLLIWVPFLWTMKYKPVHNYELKPLNYNASISESALSSGEYYISGVLKD
ncbi:MAG: PEGA domain-containing protein [Lascolabacillus sp.]|uniref:PEGA domain-containing protein n=1 Tax=Lascolabacillus sp. TaxID=1924068 RepID=UPI0025864B73|nr:PEGA domain-containing protein [Lascolabacillus sp.]MDD4757368.1 PEGA domain-containing protein [Lascolabacillus sp.]